MKSGSALRSTGALLTALLATGCDAEGDLTSYLLIELVPDAAAKDKFIAPAANVTVMFERDAGGKISAVTVVIPSGRELKGKRIN